MRASTSCTRGSSSSTLPEPERLLEMLAKATRPGGVLVVECTDMLATVAADQSDPRSRAFDEFMAMSFAAVEAMSTFDFGFARRLPRLFDALGFDGSGSQVLGRVARAAVTPRRSSTRCRWSPCGPPWSREDTRRRTRSTNGWPASPTPISGSWRTTSSLRGASVRPLRETQPLTANVGRSLLDGRFPAPTLAAVKNLRRGLLVAGMAILAGLVVRARARTVVPQASGGWRELEGPDLR